MPRVESSSIRVRAPGSSGARVIFLMGVSDGWRFEAPRQDSRSEKPFGAVWRTEVLWMPFLVGLMKGPSMWAPRDSDPSWGFRVKREGPRWGRTLG